MKPFGKLIEKINDIVSEKKVRKYLELLNHTRSVQPKLVQKPYGKKILILSPHPDDEIIGCGGTLYKHSIFGDNITCVFMTDGSKGSPIFKNRIELIEKRQKEAKKACKIIGIEKLIFLENKDQELQTSDKTISEIKNVIKNVKPDLIYLPFFIDNHRDHFETNKIFVSSIKSLKKKFKCCGYEVWTPIFPNVIVDISKFVNHKIKAFKEYKTQKKYLNAIIGLNKYRATMSEINGYAEVFYFCDSSEYIKLFDMFTGK